MNEAAKLVSDSILDESFSTIILGKEIYIIYPPSIKVLCRAISRFSKIGMDGEYNKLTVLAELPENKPYIIKGLSILIVGDVNNWRWKAYKIENKLSKLSLSNLNKLRKDVISLAGGDDFFECAASLKSMSKVAAKPKL